MKLYFLIISIIEKLDNLIQQLTTIQQLFVQVKTKEAVDAPGHPYKCCHQQDELSDHAIQHLLRKIMQCFPTEPISPQLLSVLYEFVNLASPHLKEGQPQLEDVPEHVCIQWICTKLDIERSTFYASVNGILLFPILKVGRRSYFLKSDVIALFTKTQGMGPHILGKLASKARKNLPD